VNALNNIRFIIQHLKERRDPYQKLVSLGDSEAGHKLGVRDMAKSFGRCEEILVNESFHEVHAAIFKFKRMPTIMTVGGFSPEFDYNGRSLQRLGNAEMEYHQIALSILAQQNSAAVVFTWLREARVCERFVGSLLMNDPCLFPTLAIQTAFEHLENTCMNIPWWDSLRSVEQNALRFRMQFAGSPYDERLPSCLEYCGITFDQWEFEAFKSVRMDSSAHG
jgi:hypothetical protein